MTMSAFNILKNHKQLLVFKGHEINKYKTETAKALKQINEEFEPISVLFVSPSPRYDIDQLEIPENTNIYRWSLGDKFEDVDLSSDKMNIVCVSINRIHREDFKYFFHKLSKDKNICVLLQDADCIKNQSRKRTTFFKLMAWCEYKIICVSSFSPEISFVVLKAFVIKHLSFYEFVNEACTCKSTFRYISNVKFTNKGRSWFKEQMKNYFIDLSKN
jgi:hypothetical protein